MNFPQYLEKKYLEWQQVVGERKTVREFAEYIGVSASSITMWWKGKRTPEGDNVRRLADKFGIEVYDILEIPRPDPDLLYIQQNWSNLSDKARQAIREQAEKYKQVNQNNEIQAASTKAKPRTT